MQTLRFPKDLLAILYLAIFKPVTLNRYIHHVDPLLRGTPGLYTLWRRRNEHSEFTALIMLALFHILITPLLAFLIAGLTALAGLPVHWSSMPGSIIACIAGGAVFGIMFGVAAGISFSVLFGLAAGVTAGFTIDAQFAIMVGLAAGVSVCVAFGIVIGKVIGVGAGILFGILFGLFVGAAFGLVLGMSFGMMLGASTMFNYLRIPLYLFELPLAWGLSRWEGERAIRWWRFSPVNWDELVWFPLFGLDKHLLAICRQDRQAGLEAIAQVAGSLRQDWAVRDAMIQLIGDDLLAAVDMPGAAALFETLAWLPDEARSKYKGLLLGLEEISRCARAAQEGETLYNRQEQLRRALALTRQLRQGLALAGETSLAAIWGPGLAGWEELFARELKALDSRETIPNVYVGGSPLAEASKVFKGRADLFRALENELATPAGQRPAILLFGARRTGKTSVIKQLPIRLGPQIVPVEMDLQSAATAESALGLLKRMAELILKACASRRFEVPAISPDALEKDPYPAFQAWLDAVEAALGERWLLLALDEYEALGEMLARGRVDERVFQMLRGLVQHHRLVMLFSGAHTLEDLPPLWSNYLVNVKVLKVGALKDAEAYELVTRPIPEFNLVYTDGAERLILDATACQPYLLQVVCRELVNALNEESRLQATPADVACAIDCALTGAVAYFNDLINGADSDEDQRAILTALAAKGPVLTPAQLRSRTRLPDDRLQKALRRLIHREVLKLEDGAYQYQVELVRCWVKEKA